MEIHSQKHLLDQPKAAPRSDRLVGKFEGKALFYGKTIFHEAPRRLLKLRRHRNYFSSLDRSNAKSGLNQSGLDSILQKNAEFRQSVKNHVGKGTGVRHKTLEDSLRAERAAISESIMRTDEFWPVSPLIISPTTKKSHRLNYLRQFDFSTCPALNLLVGLGAYQRHAILNEAIKKGDLTDQNGAAIGGQYCTVYISKDAAILRALGTVKNLIPYKAKVFSSVVDALGEAGCN